MPRNHAIAHPAFDAPPRRRPPGRPGHDIPRGISAALLGEKLLFDTRYCQLPTIHLITRRRLDNDAECGAEAIIPGGTARAGGALPSPLDAGGQLLHRIGALGLPWRDGPVAVTVPAADLQQGRLIAQVTQALLGSGQSGERLDLILPELALIEIDADGILSLAALRDLGVGLCIDGFGAGIASLTLLRRLPLTGLKLARALVRGLPDDHEDAAMARAIIAMAHAVGLTVVADGVETECQRAFLAHCGCDEGQGALFGLPCMIPLPNG